MIRVIPKKSKTAIRAKVNVMGSQKFEELSKEKTPFTPEAMFIQVFNSKTEKLNNYIIHKDQWNILKSEVDAGKSAMEALISSWDTIKQDKTKVKFINTVCKLLSIWGFIDIKPEGFRNKVFDKENTFEWIEIYTKEQLADYPIEYVYTLDELVEYLRVNKNITPKELGA
jgi:hypothetical protein